MCLWWGPETAGLGETMDARDTTTLLSYNTLRRWGVLVVLLLGAVVMLVLGQADRAEAAACTRYWKGTTSTAWATPTNWSNTDGGAGSTVPGPTDFVCMSTAPTRSTMVVSDAQSVAGFSFPTAGSVNPILQLTGTGVLTVGTSAVDSYASAVKTLTLASGATFGGRADVTAGTVGTLSGVTLTGLGSLTLDTTSVTSLASGTGMYIDGDYDLVNKGALTSNNAVVYLYDGTVVNQGTWTWKNPSNYPIYNRTDDAGNVVTNAAGGVVDVAPASSSDTTTLGDMPIVNNGTVKITRGALNLNVGGSGSGTYNIIPAASTLNLGGGLMNVASASFTGSGTLSLNGGGRPAGLADRGRQAGPQRWPADRWWDDHIPGRLDGDAGSGLECGGDREHDVVNNATMVSNNGVFYLTDGTFTNNAMWTWKNPSSTPIINLDR